MADAQTHIYFAAKAAQCRRLAEKVVNPSDPAFAELLKLATEYESRAAAAKREFAASP